MTPGASLSTTEVTMTFVLGTSAVDARVSLAGLGPTPALTSPMPASPYGVRLKCGIDEAYDSDAPAATSPIVRKLANVTLDRCD